MNSTDEQQKQPCCAMCGQPLSEREIDLCRKLAERFDQQFLCLEHQRIFCGCPGVRGRKIP